MEYSSIGLLPLIVLRVMQDVNRSSHGLRKDCHRAADGTYLEGFYVLAKARALQVNSEVS